MTAILTAPEDERREPRQEVLFRTRATGADGAQHLATIVNISPRGLMVRIEGEHAPGDRITLTLPRVGAVKAEVRWALGGRIGCRLERMIGISDYHAVLQTMLRG